MEKLNHGRTISGLSSFCLDKCGRIAYKIGLTTGRPSGEPKGKEMPWQISKLSGKRTVVQNPWRDPRLVTEEAARRI
jgi:hypothetical protein